MAVLNANLDLLTDEVTVGLLNSSDNPSAQQHAAIAHLARLAGPEAATTIAASSDAAAEAAFSTIDQGDPDLLTKIMLACPQLQAEPAGQLGLAILLARQDDIDEAMTKAAQARRSSSPNQRRAWTIHLAHLREALPAAGIDLTVFDHVAEPDEPKAALP